MDRRRLDRVRQAMLDESIGRGVTIREMNERITSMANTLEDDPDGPLAADLKSLLAVETAGTALLDEEKMAIGRLGAEAEGLSDDDVRALQKKEGDDGSDSSEKAEEKSDEETEAGEQEEEATEDDEEKTDPKKSALKSLGLKVIRLEADAAKYGKKEPEIYDELKEARAEYEAARLEYVEDNIERSVEALELQVANRLHEAEDKRGIIGKVFAVYNKLGEWNLEALGYKPTTKAGKLLSKMVSVRTAVPAVLVGGAFALGAGSAVGIGALAVRRVIAGPMGAFGLYKAQTRGTEIKQGMELSKEDLDKLGFEGSLERMEEILGQNLVDGRSPYDNPAYLQLRDHFIEIATDEQRQMIQDGRWGELSMERFMKKVDANVEVSRKQAKSKDVRRKVVAGVGGAVIGSGALASFFGGVTRWAGETLGIIKGGGKAVAKGVVESHGSSAGTGHAAEASPKATEPAHVEKPKHVASRSGSKGAGVRGQTSAGSRQGTGKDVFENWTAEKQAEHTASLSAASAPAPKPPIPGATVDVLRGRQVAGYRADMPRPSAPTPDHAAPAEAPAAPKTVPAETVRPSAESAVELSTPNSIKISSGEVHISRDATGQITKVYVDATVSGSPLDALKDDWIMKAAEHNPNSTPGMLRVTVESRVRTLLTYKAAFQELSARGNVSQEALKILEKTINQSSKMLTDRYGDILK